MRIVVPVVSSAHTISGVSRHAINMVRSLLQSERIEHVHVVAGNWQHYLPELLKEHPRLSLEMADLRNDLVSRNLWYAMKLSGIVQQQGADLVHYSFPAPVRPGGIGVPTVVTLHDLYPHDLPENFGAIKAPFNRMILRQCLAAADAIACVSHSTQDRLDCVNPLLALRSSHVIPNCVQGLAARATPPSGLSGDEPFVLCVAQHRRNKNLLALLRAFVHLRGMESDQPIRLVIVGMAGPETIEIKKFIVAHHLQDCVMLRSGLSEGELRWCYEQCLVLAAPSVVEGFGLPVAEALMAGCRVVCSDIPAFREVGGIHCRYVDLDESSDMRFAHAIAEAISRPKPEAIALARYSSKAVASQYEELYRSVMRRNHSRNGSRKCGTAERMEDQVKV
jgi:glycosyltransferase involved in cell wall biosynthesis